MHHSNNMKRGKNYRKAQENYDRNAVYSPEEALDLLEKFPKAKFDESVELHIKTNIDATKSDQQIRGALQLPHGTGKTFKIAAFTETQQAEAKKAGAHLVGGAELIEQIKTSSTIDFDKAVATPEMMPKLAQVAKILGPRGLMPNPKTQTVGPKIDVLIEGFKKGNVSFKNDSSGNVHQAIGKRSFTKDQIKENLEAFVNEFKKNKPAGAKGKFIQNASISATMTPGIRVSLK